VRENRSRQRFVDRAIERLVERLLPSLPQILTHTVEDDDRIVERIAEHREQTRDDSQRDLQVHQLEERDCRKDIVARRDHRRRGESPLEPDRQVNERNEEGQQDRDDRSALQLISHAGPDGFGAHDLQIVLTELLLQHSLDGDGDALSTLRL